MSGNNNSEMENCLQYFCEMLKKKVLANKNNPEVIALLKEMGKEVLNKFPDFPEWQKFYRAFFIQ